MKRDIAYGTAALLTAIAAAVTANAITGTPEQTEDVQATEEPIRQVVAVYDVREQYGEEQEDEPEEEREEEDYSWIPLEEELAAVLAESCGENGVPLALALAVMEQESCFQADALNIRSGCYGLMQLNPSFFPSGLSPADNIRYGVEYLGDLLEQYGDEAHAATAYFYGPTDMETSWYSDDVMENMEKWGEYVGH